MKRGKIYKIEWSDTFSYSNWMKEKTIDELSDINKKSIESIGYFIKEKNGFVIICQELEHNPDFMPFGNVQWIPRGTIKKIKELK